MSFKTTIFRAAQIRQILHQGTVLKSSLKNLSYTTTNSLGKQKLQVSVYLNHHRYVAVCTKYFNKQLNNADGQPNAIQTEQQPQPTQDQQQQQKSGFYRLFQKENAWKVSLGFIGVLCSSLAGYLLVTWGAPQVDQLGNTMKDEFSEMPLIVQYVRRSIHSAFIYYQMFKDPTSDKLLPEPLQEPYYQPPYTLVIELVDVLVHPEWTYSNGWRYKKRPGLDYFIEQVKYPMFEVVFFTREPYMSLAPVVAALDPNNNVQFKLFRESTKFMNNTYVKDLKCLNRDIRKIILIDSDENAYKLQSRNALHRTKAWKGEEDDTDLVYLASFLKTIAASGVEDVRDVLDYYNKEVNPLEAYKLNQVKLQEAEEQRQREMEEWKKKQTTSPFSWARRR